MLDANREGLVVKLGGPVRVVGLGQISQLLERVGPVSWQVEPLRQRRGTF